MEIIEKLLERINVYNKKMQSEKNISTKMSYLEEIIRVGQITKDLHFIVCTSILNMECSSNVGIVGSTMPTQTSDLSNYLPLTR